MTTSDAVDQAPFDDAENLLADMEGVEAVHEGRRLAAEKLKRTKPEPAQPK